MNVGLSIKGLDTTHRVPPFEIVFRRCPVIVGRDDTVASCVLNDVRVSRIHASIDMRNGQICVRDAGSRNGTFAGSTRVATERWTPLGPLERPCEIRIGDWILTLSAHELTDASAPSSIDDFFTSIDSLLAGTMIVPNVSASEPPAGHAGVHTQISSREPMTELPRSVAAMLAARQDLFEKIIACIESAAPANRANVVASIVQMYPVVEQDPMLRALVEQRSGVALKHTVESSSTLAMLELARWYVNGQRQPNTAEEIFIFARKLKTGIDELLLGLVPLFAGHDRFEQQMALRSDSDELPASWRFPRTPREAASRLFDWRTPSDDAVRAMRTDLVDLTMHQVAILNGVMRGVKVLLEELAPEAIEQAWHERHMQKGFWGRFFSKLRVHHDMWALYCERHSDFADEENERFRVIFGPEFAEEYKHSGEARVKIPSMPSGLEASASTWAKPSIGPGVMPPHAAPAMRKQQQGASQSQPPGQAETNDPGTHPLHPPYRPNRN
ncbi:MAG: FHA domain-containing protein [Polyangiaceae bacterium]|nr:FHA domain-containing protein [Polyangiaceae bacterium]